MPHAKCKLCLRITDLQNSHLMPASLYKKSRIPSTSNPNPTLVTEKGSKQTSRQIRNFVLCHDCEQLFSKNGESYVMTQVFDGKSKKFPLLDTLQATAPTWGGPEFVGYELAATPDLDREKLGYFALSVFWRASVHIWRERGEEPVTLELGKSTTRHSGSTFSGRQDFRRTSCCSSSRAPTRSRKTRFTSRAWGARMSNGHIHSWRRASTS